MKSRLSLLAILLVLPACQVRSGWTNANGSGYIAANLGNREREVTQSAGGYAALEQSGEAAFRDARWVAQTGLVVAGLTDVAGIVNNGWKSVTSSNNATKLGIQKSADAVKTAEIQAATEQAAIEAAPAAAAP